MPTLFEEHLRHADPCRDVPAYTDAERRLLLADATADSRVTELPLRTPGRRWPRVAVAAAAGLTALGLLGVQLMGGVQPPLATAEEVLDAAAIHATDPTAADGQYWRITRSGTVVHVELVEGGGDRTYIVSDVDVHYRPVSGQGASWFVDGADAVERQVHAPHGVARALVDQRRDPEPDRRLGRARNRLPAGGGFSWAMPAG